MHPILTIFSFIAASYVTPFIYSHTQNIYICIYIYFLFLLLIRLYSNNVFKVSAVILSNAMISLIASDNITDDAAGTCNMIQRMEERKERIDIAKKK